MASALSATTFCARNRARRAAPLPDPILRSALRLPREGRITRGAPLGMTAILPCGVFRAVQTAFERYRAPRTGRRAKPARRLRFRVACRLDQFLDPEPPGGVIDGRDPG